LEASCFICALEAWNDALTYLTEAEKRGAEVTPEEWREFYQLGEQMRSRVRGASQLVFGSNPEGGIPSLGGEAKAFKEGKGNSLMAVEALDGAFRWLEGITGLSAEELNDIWMPEITGTVVGDILYDTIFGKVGSALFNLITGGIIEGLSIGLKDSLSKRDARWLHELGAHMVTRFGRIFSPGEFSLALREAREMGVAFGEKRYTDAFRKLVKTPEALSFSFEEVKRAYEELTAPLPVPAVPAVPPVVAPPAPAPPAVPAPAVPGEVL
jgi:hypothetical protein